MADSTQIFQIFKDALAEQIELNGYTRKKICEAVGITPSALSQYLHGTALPSIATLVAFAKLFNVPVDKLIRQPSGAALEEDVLFVPLQRALKNIQRQNAAHDRLVQDVGDRLSKEIEQVTLRALKEIDAGVDVWPDPDLLVLEKYSVLTKILTLDFRYDFNLEKEDKRGDFFYVVWQNLRQKRAYQFLLAGSVAFWKDKHIIDEFRARLPPQVAHLCEIRCTTAPVIAGCGFYQLDVEALQRENADMVTRLQVFGTLDAQGGQAEWMGYVMAPGDKTNADLQMDVSYVERSLNTFNDLWEHAEIFPKDV